MKELYILFCFMIFPLLAISQTSIIWENSFGGSDQDVGTSITTTNDGGYIIAGHSESIDGDVTGNNGYIDYWIVKIDSLGNIEWENNYGGSDADYAQSVVQTDEGEYMVSGFTFSFDGDVSGNHSWPGNKDYWVIKINNTGSLVWQKCFGGGKDEQAMDFIKDKFGNYLIVGTAQSYDGDITDFHGGPDAWVVKIDSAGNTIWKKSYGGTGTEQGWSIANTNNGYIIAGSSTTINGDVTVSYGCGDAWIIRIDYDGNIIWQNSYGGSDTDEAFAIVQDNDGNFYIACNSWSDDGLITQHIGDSDWWILKIDSTGNLLWQETVGGIDGDEAWTICLADDGGCIAGGYYGVVDNFILIDENYWLVKFDESGNICWTDTLGGSNYDVANSIQALGGNKYIVAGYSYSSDGDVSNHHGSSCTSPDYWIVEVMDLDSTTTIFDISANKQNIKVYPNPTHNTINFQIPQQFGLIKTLEIFDCIGQLKAIKTDNFSEMDISYLTSGLYYIVLTNNENERQTIKIIKE